MNWMIITTTEGKRIIVNVKAVLSVTYLEDSDLTEIVLTRSNYAPLYVTGNIASKFQKALFANSEVVCALE